jgi:hypothetical protein
MADLLRTERLAALASWQNRDGGWGYFPGATSWVEPTAWAVAALHGEPGYEGQVRLALAWLGGMQRTDGACRPQAKVEEPSWVTALFVLAHLLEGVAGDAVHAAARWLVAARGAEGSLWRRAVARALPREEGYEPDHYGWSWAPGTNSWVEPTAHSLLALKLYRQYAPERRVDERRLEWRIRLGEQMLRDRRCRDGGWNYGARQALGVALPSYVETTAIALAALQSREPALLAVLDERRRAPASPLGRAWLELAQALLSGDVAPTQSAGRADILVEAIGLVATNRQALARLRLEALS